uniref:Uncharacterized protein n=1 Tax=Ignisphaera aggregans TaxID=334771 RepID=A0A7J2U0K9_9CREN
MVFAKHLHRRRRGYRANQKTLFSGYKAGDSINMLLREARANTSKNIYYVYRHALKMLARLVVTKLGEV